MDDAGGAGVIDGLTEAARALVGEADRAVLARAFVDARAAWPDVPLAPAELGAALAPVICDAGSLALALESVRVRELYLARAAATEGAGRRALLAHYRGVLDDALARLGVEDADREAVRDAAFASLARYRGRQTLAAWLRAAVARVAPAETEPSEGSQPVLLPDEQEDAAPAVAEAVAHAFAAAAAELPVRERNVLRFHLSGNLSLDEIGAIYRTSRAEVAGWVAGARERLLDAAAAHVRERCEGDLRDAALALVETRLDRVVEQRLSRAPEQNTDPERPSARGVVPPE